MDLIPGRSSRRIFFSRDNSVLTLTLSSELIPPHNTAAACKNFQSFCQTCTNSHTQSHMHPLNSQCELTFLYDLVPKGAHARGYALQLKIKHCWKLFLFKMLCCVLAWMNEYIVQIISATRLWLISRYSHHTLKKRRKMTAKNGHACTELFLSLCLQTNRKHMENQSLICTRKTSFYTDNITSTLTIVVFSINWSWMFALYVRQMCCKLKLKTLNCCLQPADANVGCVKSSMLGLLSAVSIFMAWQTPVIEIPEDGGGGEWQLTLHLHDSMYRWGGGGGNGCTHDLLTQQDSRGFNRGTLTH